MDGVALPKRTDKWVERLPLLCEIVTMRTGLHVLYVAGG